MHACYVILLIHALCLYGCLFYVEEEKNSCIARVKDQNTIVLKITESHKIKVKTTTTKNMNNKESTTVKYNKKNHNLNKKQIKRIANQVRKTNYG